MDLFLTFERGDAPFCLYKQCAPPLWRPTRRPCGGGTRGVGRGKNVRRVLPPRSAAPIPGRASKARREPGSVSSRPPGASPAKGPPLAGAGEQARARAGRGAEPPKTEATSSGAEKEATAKTERPGSAAERGDSPPARRRTTSLLRVAQNSSNLPLKKIFNRGGAAAASSWRPPRGANCEKGAFRRLAATIWRLAPI